MISSSEPKNLAGRILTFIIETHDPRYKWPRHMVEAAIRGATSIEADYSAMLQPSARVQYSVRSYPWGAQFRGDERGYYHTIEIYYAKEKA